MNENIIVRMEHITKRFGPVTALNQVDFELYRGETHCLLGENGSGKSTLIKLLGGIYERTDGKIYIEGKEVDIDSVKTAGECGISIVHQELSFAPMMTVTENIFMGREYRNKMGFIDTGRMRREAKQSLEAFGSDIHPDVLMNDLSVSQQQVVEIVKALSNNARILIMDEPSASLSMKEVENLYAAVDRLRELGISIIYVSHRMEELFRLGDRVTVLRDGEYIGTKNLSETDEDDLIHMMVGRSIESHYGEHELSDSEVVLEVRDLTRGSLVKGINLSVRKGEVVGLAGIVGAGRTETARVIAGIDRGYQGEILLNGEAVRINRPGDAISRGIVLIPEDRKTQGLVMGQTVQEKGEVVGLAGIVGAGRTETARVIAGIDRGYQGEILLNGEAVRINRPGDAISRGIVLIPEDRKTQGLVMGQTVQENVVITILKRFIKFVGVNFRSMNEETDALIERFHIKVSSRNQRVGNLSGGNQQKVVLAKWLATNPKVLILDEPTRGIDVGAKAEIYRLIDRLAGRGMSTLIISSDLPELMRVCDSIYVMKQGTISGKLMGDELTQEIIMKHATGGVYDGEN